MAKARIRDSSDDLLNLVASTQSIPYNVTTPDFLEKHAKVQAAELLIDVISNLPRRAAQAWSQSENRRGVTPSFAPKIRRENCEIKWNKWSAGDIAARARAMQHVVRGVAEAIAKC